jgi:hypothetical protein
METPGKQWARRKARREQQEHLDWPPPPYSNGRIIGLMVGLGLAVIALLLLLWIGLVEPT